MEETSQTSPSPVPGAMASETATSVPIRHLEFKVALLLALTLVLAVAFTAYVLYARGVFDSTQRVVLLTDDSEGVNVGMPLTFAGFSIGRVRGIELADNAQVRILIDVPVKDARWLRVSSVFVIEKALVGGVRIRAVTGQLEDAPLPNGAVRTVLRGDATEEIPRLISGVRELLENLQRMTAADSSLNASLGNVNTVTERMAGRSGVLAAALGSEDNAKKVFAALDRTNALLDSVSGVSAKLGQTLDKTDQRLFGAGGVMDESQKAVVQINAILNDARESLKKADAVLADVQKIGANASAATDGLGALRSEVDASLRKVNSLIDEVNRKWPFKRDTELKLP
jgi:phospholipid/cholesterol/gamma-HCH transport system substrate-binding protein